MVVPVPETTWMVLQVRRAIRACKSYVEVSVGQDSGGTGGTVRGFLGGD
jgi:hypothetical protein